MSEVAALGIGAFRELEERRRERRLRDWNVIDALYRAYVTALVGAVGLLWLSGVVAEEVPSGRLRMIAERAPGILGVLLAVLCWAGAVSGQRGGPLTVLPAMVRLVLLAPVERADVLRGAALRKLRFGAFAGAVLGAATGVFAFRRLGGPPASWLAATIAFGAAAGVLMPAVALIVSGRTLGVRVVQLVVSALGAGAVVDAVAGTARTPLAMAGSVGVAPLAELGRAADASRVTVGAAVLALAALVTPAVGVLGLGGIALEPLERRSRLIALLRFAATMRDLRAVILLRRQLSQEMPRTQPWRRIPGRGRFVVWRRDLQGLMRWPAMRCVRLVGLGVVVGATTVAAMAGTAELVVVSAFAMYLAAAEATEGFAQEVDRPTLRTRHPVHDDVLWARHLAAPTAVLTAVGVVGVLTATAIAGTAAMPAMAVVVPGALAAAVMSSRQALADPAAEMQLMLADVTGAAALMRVLGPPLMVGSAPVLLVALWHLRPEAGAGGAMSFADIVRMVVLLEAVLGLGVVSYRVGRASRLPGGLSGLGALPAGSR